MTSIQPHQLEGSWNALTTRLAPNRGAPDENISNPEVEIAAKKVHEIFSNWRIDQAGFTGVLAEHWTPRVVADFIAGLSKRVKPKSILDPTCGYGFLLATVASVAEAEMLLGIEINHELADKASQIWGGAIEVVKSEALSYLERNESKYDMIVCDPPINLRLNPQWIEALQGKPPTNDFTLALILSSLKALSPNGTAIFTVSPSFLLESQREKFLACLYEIGFKITACIQAPSGTRHNTSIATYLLVIDRGDQGDVFIGQLKDDPTHLDHLLSNLHRKKAKGDPSLGRLCSLSSFQGFESFAAREQLERLAREWKWSPHNGRDIIKEYELSRAGRPARNPSLHEDASSLFVKLIGKPQASRHREGFSKSAEMAHIKLNTDLVDPSFLQYWINESRIGQLTLDSAQTGTTIPRTSVDSLLKATIYLPTKDQQHCVCDAWSYLQKVRSEADELESALSDWAEPPDQILPRIKAINQEDRYEDWLESLPFPLASILWRHHAAKDSFRERFQMLLHFFEATAAFVATIHLSAYMSSDGEWERIREDLSSKLSSKGLSLERATFGSWKLVVERLASATSSALRKAEENQDEMSVLAQIYGTSDRQSISMLCDKKLLRVLQDANKIRNNNLGHSGAVGEAAAKQVHDELMDLIYQLRSAFGRRWGSYELLQPGAIRYKAGIYYITCKRIMGSRSAPFEEREYESAMPLEADCLYLFDSVCRTGLKLQPFVEVMPSPERQAVACFIFNRVEKDSARWVSYHFDQESEISLPSTGVLNALSRLNRSGSPGGSA
jgi:hypothetical protein